MRSATRIAFSRSSLFGSALAVASLIVSMASAQVPSTDSRADQRQIDDGITSFLKQHCIRCHGKEKQEGKAAFHQLRLTSDLETQGKSWQGIVDKLESGEMPPEDQDQPSLDERKQVVQWIKRALRGAGISIDESKLLHPSRGNWMDHDLLFSGKPTDPPATRGRLWRLTGQGYEEFILSLSKRHYLGIPSWGSRRIRSPWELSPHEGFRDYANQHRIGEPEIEQHLRNAKRVANGIMLKLNKRSGIQEFKDLVRADSLDTPIAPKQVEAAAAAAVDGILGRQPTERELKRYAGFLQSNMESLGTKGAIEQLLVAVLFHPEVMYRIELPIEGEKRARMVPRELARSIAYALTDQEPDEELLKAADAGKLSSRDDIGRQALRILNDDRIAKPRILRFFQEYFGYTKARDVFKDETTRKEAGLRGRGSWQPDIFVSDTDRTILWILKQDENVLRELLTTAMTFTSTGDSREAQRVKKNADRAFDSAAQTALDIYEIAMERTEWSDERPFEMPSNHRKGILTHPSWLIAHSTNFDNHAIQRGHWIQERLLGGSIPEVPVTVDAQLPDEAHKTLRERMRCVPFGEVIRVFRVWERTRSGTTRRIPTASLAMKFFRTFVT